MEGCSQHLGLERDPSASSSVALDKELSHLHAHSRMPLAPVACTLNEDSRRRDVMVGSVFGRYLIQEEIGRGGMGVVYRAHDMRLGRAVAIKVLSERCRLLPAAWGMVLREAQMTCALNHPSICTIYDAGEEDAQPFIAMEFVEGCGLQNLLEAGGWNSSLIAHVSRQVLSALGHAHERGIIHRDVKSSNIIITPQGGVKMLDFGLAKHIRGMIPESAAGVSTSAMEFDALAGTIHYLAPEVLRGARANVWSDIWSFGVVLYEMATGQLPFRGRTVFEVTTAIMTSGPLSPGKQLPAWMARMIAGCLRRNVAGRYHCVREMMADLPPEGTADELALAIHLDRFSATPVKYA